MPILRRPALLSLVLLSAFSAFGQQATAPSVPDAQRVGIDLVAVGRDGSLVPGLTPADFEVLKDGKPQQIVQFTEVTPQAAKARLLTGASGEQGLPASIPARRIVLFLDESTLSPDNRKAVLSAAAEFLTTRLRPGDEATIVTWNGELKTRAPWTGDAGTLTATLKAIGGELTSSHLQAEKQRVERLMSSMAAEAENPDQQMRASWSEIENAARFYAESYKHDLAQSTAALAKLLASFAGIDGRKVLVMASESMPTLAGAEVFERLESIRTAVVANSESPLNREARSGSRVGDMSRYNVTPFLELIAKAANAANISIYGLNPGAGDGRSSGNVEQEGPVDAGEQIVASDRARGGFVVLAERTGGASLVGLPAPLAFERINADLDSYYTLAYRAVGTQARDRRIEVRSKRPDLRVRARTSVHARPIEREMADRIVINQVRSRPTNDLGVLLEKEPVRPDGARQLLPVRVIIPVNSLALGPDGKGGVTGAFSVFTCAGDGAGWNSGVNVQSHTLNFTAEQAAQMKGRAVGFAILVPVEKGRDRVSVGVLDHTTLTTGFATLQGGL